MEGMWNVVIYGGVVPVAVTALVLLGIWWGGRRLSPATRMGVAVGSALGVGDLAGHFGIAWPGWPPTDVTDRVPFLVMAGLLAAWLNAVRPGKWFDAWIIRVVFSLTTALVIVEPVFSDAWKVPATWGILSALVAVMVLAWFNLDAVAARQSGAPLFLPIVLLALGTSATLAISGVAVQGMLAGVLAASLVGAWLLTTWHIPSLTLARGGTSIVVVALSSLLLVGHFYANVPTTSLVLLAASPLALWAAEFKTFKGRAPWLRTLVSSVAILIPIGLAIGFAVAAMPEETYYY